MSTRFRTLAVLLLLLGLGACPAFAQGKVVLLMSAKIKIYETIVQGLRQTVQGNVQEVVMGENEQKSLDALNRSQADVVVAVGNNAALLLKNHPLGTPVVVTGLTYQYDSKRFQGMTGVYLDFPVSTYLRLIREAFPKLKRVGIFYDPTRNAGLVQEAEKTAKELAFEFDTYPIRKEKDIGHAIQRLKERRVEAFIMTNDPLIMNQQSFKYFVGFSISNRMILVVPYGTLLKSGAVMSYEADYGEVGRQTGHLVSQILTEGKESVEPGLRFPRKGDLGVNPKMADILGMSFSPEIMGRANNVQQ